MTQPTFVDGPPVPLLVEGVLEEATLRQLFSELTAATTVLSAREKAASTALTCAEELTPDAALGRLLSGTARAVQVRYQFAGHEWTDTILALPSGFRVVRCRHEAAT